MQKRYRSILIHLSAMLMRYMIKADGGEKKTVWLLILFQRISLCGFHMTGKIKYSLFSDWQKRVSHERF